MSNTIPNLNWARKLKKGYRDHPIDTDHRLYNEPLVDMEKFGLEGKNHYGFANNPPVEGSMRKLYARKTVAEKLKILDRKFRSAYGIKLFIKDAYRPLCVQRHIEKVVMRRKLLKEFPNLDDSEIKEKISDLVASSNDLMSPPPHLTGGAIDLEMHYLDSNTPVEVGKSLGLKNADPDSLHNKQRSGQNISKVEEEAIKNRTLLYDEMIHIGFMVNPTEYWHFSYGDQMWARLMNKPQAFYGPAPLLGLPMDIYALFHWDRYGSIPSDIDEKYYSEIADSFANIPADLLKLLT